MCTAITLRAPCDVTHSLRVQGRAVPLSASHVWERGAPADSRGHCFFVAAGLEEIVGEWGLRPGRVLCLQRKGNQGGQPSQTWTESELGDTTMPYLVVVGCKRTVMSVRLQMRCTSQAMLSCRFHAVSESGLTSICASIKYI